ncbi:PILR alpha-associated neural protein isoform X2 [Esox lucius]|uniref:PILR alpha-associated neural protein isoform X2 n=1 Tax=Esox lucius TaxID=8010 RepID=UPI001476CA30|nr:PILR alpha-associated neural protein isoform X2 [Esox lucius]
MERCFISAVTRPTALRCVFFLLVAAVTRPSTCNRDDGGEGQVEAASTQLSVTGQVTPTPIWSVDWGPTLPLEDETPHILSSQETDPHHRGRQVPATTAEAWPYQSAPGSAEPQEPRDLLEAPGTEGVVDGGSEAEEGEPEEVDPQFYVTVTISSLLILTAVIITAKLWIPVVNF